MDSDEQESTLGQRHRAVGYQTKRCCLALLTRDPISGENSVIMTMNKLMQGNVETAGNIIPDVYLLKAFFLLLSQAHSSLAELR